MRVIPSVLLFLAGDAMNAQSPLLPPIRQSGTPAAMSARVFGRITVVRALPDGRLLINDPGLRRLMLADSAFNVLAVIADTSANARVQYGSRPPGLLPYAGDSSLFIETTTPAMYMIDPSGRVVRTMAVPAARDAPWMTQATTGAWASTDEKGRIVYRGPSPRPSERPMIAPGELRAMRYPDSAPLLRADPVTRQVETLAWFKVLKIDGTQYGRPDGRTVFYPKMNPLPVVEDFAVLPDGTVAILRGDYHVDIVGGERKILALPRIPYHWVRLTDSAKTAVVDSVKAALDGDGTGPPRTVGTAGSASGASGLTVGTSSTGKGDDERARSLMAVSSADLPDYRPAFKSGALRADMSGRLWIRTEQPGGSPGVAVYDVVTAKGTLVDRVELPSDRSIAGFDRTSVFLAGRDSTGGWLERVRLP